MAEVGALVLAAGRATRFGAGPDDSKAYALLEGRALVAHVARVALTSRARPVVVVTGQGAERAGAALAGLDVLVAHNARYAEGMASSLQTGLAQLPASCEAVLVLLADMPSVRFETLDTLIGTFARERPDAVVPVHHGRRGNPVLLGRTLFSALSTLDGDEGARRILEREGVAVAAVEVDDPGVLLDVDTPQALAALRAARA